MPPNPNPGFVFWGVGRLKVVQGSLSTSLEGLGSERALPGTSPDVRTCCHQRG